MLNCKTFEPQLLEHAYGLLEPHEAEVVLAHLASCPDCTAQVAHLGGLLRRAAIGSFPSVRFDPSQPPKPTIEPKSAAPARTMRSTWVKWTVAATVLLAVAVPAQASMTYFLTKTWISGGNMFCQYNNGTVLNIGVGPCPVSIQG